MFGELSPVYAVQLSLYFENLRVGAQQCAEQTHGRIKSLLLVERIPRDTSWGTWYRETTGTQSELELVLPALDTPSTILVIGHAVSAGSRDRHDTSGFLQKLIGGMRADARRFPGEETSVNAIEIPPSADFRLTLRRLVYFLYQEPPAADNNIVRYEDIEDQSIKMALTASEL